MRYLLLLLCLPAFAQESSLVTAHNMYKGESISIEAGMSEPFPLPLKEVRWTQPVPDEMTIQHIFTEGNVTATPAAKNITFVAKDPKPGVMGTVTLRADAVGEIIILPPSVEADGYEVELDGEPIFLNVMEKPKIRFFFRLG